MSDYLNSLVTRTLGLAPVVQPRPASLFEPVAPAGTVSEAAFAVSEKLPAQQKVAATPLTKDHPFDVPAKTREPVVDEFPVHTAPLPTLLPTQVTRPTTLLDGIWDRDRDSKRGVRDQELSPLPGETDLGTSATERPQQTTASLIRPEVRVVSQTPNRERVQSAVTTPPLGVVPSNTPQPDALARGREFNAQTAAPAEAPETVVVTIGRVDVRAIFAPPQAAPRPTRTQPQPLSLDEYLKQRSEGRR